MKNAGAAPCKEVSQRAGVTAPSCFETIERLVCKGGFSMEVVCSDIRRSTAYLYQGKWSTFLHWCHGRKITPCEVTILQIAGFLLYLHWEFELTVPAINGYRFLIFTDFTVLLLLMLVVQSEPLTFLTYILFS